MSQSVMFAARPLAAVGTAAVIGAAAVLPATVAASSPALRIATPAVALTSAGSTIINAYNAVEPWAAYGAELAQWALSYVPGLWWAAPGIDLAYFTAEPVVQSVVYSFAYLIDGQLGLIGPELALGFQTASTNFVNYGLAWINSLVPLPPLPPLPPFPGAAVNGPAAARSAVGPRVTPRAAAARPAKQNAAADAVAPHSRRATAGHAQPAAATARKAHRTAR